MIQPFKGPYPFDDSTLKNWNSTIIGVYYCGAKTPEGKLAIHYIGRAVGEDGIRGRLIQHLSEDKWRDTTHFGYESCDSAYEAIAHETSEISKYKPKYNTIGK